MVDTGLLQHVQVGVRKSRQLVGCSDVSAVKSNMSNRMNEPSATPLSESKRKTHIRGTRAVSQLVFLLHVGALVSALPSSAPRKSDV